MRNPKGIVNTCLCSCFVFAVDFGIWLLSFTQFDDNDDVELRQIEVNKRLLHHGVTLKAHMGRMTGLIVFTSVQSKHLKSLTVVISTQLRGALFISS